MQLRNILPIAAKPQLSRPCFAPPPPPTRDLVAAHNTHTLDASVISDGYGSMQSSSSVDDEYEDTAPIDLSLTIVEDEIDALFMHSRNVFDSKKNVTEIIVNDNNTAQMRAQFYDIDNDDELCNALSTGEVGAHVM
jgi:hypothetical protein